MSARHRLLAWVSWTVLVASLGEAATPDDASASRASSRAEAKVASSIESLIEADWIDRDARFEIHAGEPAAKPHPGEMTTALDAAGGCDGVKTGRCGFHTASQEQDPWWQVDLGSVVELDRIVIYNRTDASPERTRHIRVLAAPDPAGPFSLVYQHNGEVFFGVKEGKPLVVRFNDQGVSTRIVRLEVPGRCSMALDEIEVYGRDDPQRNVALGRPADQKSIGPYSRFEQSSTELPQDTSRPALPAFSLEHSQDVLRRARALAGRLRAQADPARLGPLVVELDELDARVRKIKANEEVTEAIRRDIYLTARQLARRIAFANPVLDFDRILFIKRHDPAGLYHMVHQYYGFGAVPGGGLFVLSNPFSDSPRVDDLLAKSRVEQGALRGQRLVPGSFLSPELSFDGRTVLFAYTQAQGEKPEWSPRASYHIFKCDADGRNLVQLTDGPWNE
ncbi:MAG: discoidin domain-containing protein, partial [Thermoguttaceae bacterium]|nr:discoidin domain-containing protein [Thermoguttaceae bacterium]